MVNERVYFKKQSNFAIWWNGEDKWIIGLDCSKGSKWGFGSFDQDVLCPHQITEWNGKLYHGKEEGLQDAGYSLVLEISVKGNFFSSQNQMFTYSPYDV